MKKLIIATFAVGLLAFCAVATVLVMAIMSDGDAVARPDTSTPPEIVVSLPEASDTLIATLPGREDTPMPTITRPPTVTPMPEYSGPVILLEVSGVGTQVTENYQLPPCTKAVFYWAASSADGTASLIASLHNVATGNEYTIANEFGFDLAGDLTGAALHPLIGGEYFFSTENTDQAWFLRVECQDGQAPAGTGIDIQGNGLVVTPNYELPACAKSVFIWSAQPDGSGSASLIVGLVKVGDNRLYTLVNEMSMDLTGPMEGKALQAVDGGLYYLITENTTEPWRIRWECQD